NFRRILAWLRDFWRLILTALFAAISVQSALRSAWLLNGRLGNDQLHALQAAVDQMAQKRRPAGFVLLGALADPQDLAKSFRIDGRGHQQRNVADLAGPAALHDNAVEERYGCSPSIRRFRQASASR